MQFLLLRMPVRQEFPSAPAGKKIRRRHLARLIRRRGALQPLAPLSWTPHLSLLPWLGMLGFLTLVALLRGFTYPVGAGWADDTLDLAGLLLALGGVVLARALRSETSAGFPMEVWALGAGFGLVIGKVGLAVAFGALYALTLTVHCRKYPARTAFPLRRQCLRHLTLASNFLCTIAALGILFMMWEDIVAPGGLRDHRFQLGLLGCSLALLGLVWAARMDGEPGAASRQRGNRLPVVPAAPVLGGGMALASGFLLLAAFIQLPGVAAWDAAQIRAFHHSGGPAITQLMRKVSNAGGSDQAYYWLPIITLLVGWATRGRSVRFLLFSILGAPCLGLVLKATFHRARPVFTHGAHFDSFPSSHTLFAAVLATTLLFIFWPRCRPGVTRAGLILLAAAWPLLMAASRVYLGSHFPTDVLAGLLLGGAWTCLCFWLVSVLAPVWAVPRESAPPSGSFS